MKQAVAADVGRDAARRVALIEMLANIYLHYALDVRFKELGLKRIQRFRFCDDFVITSQKESELLSGRKSLDRWMEEAGLRLKEPKTQVVDMRNEKRGPESHFFGIIREYLEIIRRGFG